MKPQSKQTDGVSVEVRIALTHLDKALSYNEKRYEKQNKIFWSTVTDTNKWGNGIEAEKLDKISQEGKKIKNAIAILSNLL